MSLYIGGATDVDKQIMHLTGESVEQAELSTTSKIPSTIYHSIDSDFPFVIYQETLTLGSYSADSAQFNCQDADNYYTYHYKSFNPSDTLSDYLNNGYHMLVEVTISGEKSYPFEIVETGLIIGDHSNCGISNGDYLIDTRLNKVIVVKYSSGGEQDTSYV